MIRRATLGDVTAMVRLLDGALARSIYAGKGEINRVEANRLLFALIQRHGGVGGGGTWVTVCETDGEVSGMLVGILQPVLHVGTAFSATDLFWLTDERASPYDSAKLMLSFHGWAKAHPKCIEIVCGATGAMGEWEKAGGMLERMGLSRFGGLYRMEAAA